LLEHIERAANENYAHRDNTNAPGSTAMGAYGEVFDRNAPDIPQSAWENGVGLVQQEQPKKHVRQYLPDYIAATPM
jgi:hypothetical protein